MMEQTSRGYDIPDKTETLFLDLRDTLRQINDDLDRVAIRQEYVASLTQIGTAAPTATIGENSLPGLPVFARTSAGLYTMTLTGAFPAVRTKVFLNPVVEPTSGKTATAVRTSDNVLTIDTVGVDGILSDTGIQIIVYPSIISALLLEDGFALLQENGNVIDLE